MDNDKQPIKRDRSQKFGRLSAMQEAENFAKNNNLKTEPLFSREQKNSLHKRNIIRNSQSGLAREEVNRSFKLTPISSAGLQIPFVASNIQLPSNALSTPSLTDKTSDYFKGIYNKILDKVDNTNDKLIGGAIGFTNKNTVPGFKTDTSEGLSRFNVTNNPLGTIDSKVNNLMLGNLDELKQAYINEASKSVRNMGDNIDPFNSSKSARHLGRLRQLQNRINGGGTSDLLRESRSVRDQLNSVNKALNVTGGTEEVQSLLSQRDTLLKQESQIGRKLERNARILSTDNPYYNFESRKNFLPKEGITGYGLGMNNYMAASRKELLVRGLGFTGGIVGPSGAEALMNSFGIVTAKQKAYTQSRELLGKVMSSGMQAPLMTYGSLLFTAASGGDLTDFVETQLTFAGGLQGWRIGSSFGGALFKGSTANISNVGAGNMISAIRAQGGAAALRGAAGLVGGATGFALGALAVSGAAWLAQDLTSNRSTIKKIAKDFTTKTATMNTQNTRQSLTMRQMAISKLAKSGLNDRATLLGNESRVLKGIM